MESSEIVIYDPNLLSLIMFFLDDHFDILNLSLTSKFHRETVVNSVQRITYRQNDSLMETSGSFSTATQLDLSRVVENIDDSDFTVLIPKLPNLKTLKIAPLIVPKNFLVSLKQISQLKVLHLENCFLDDKIAEQIGKGCELLEDITLQHTTGPLTNYGLNDLLLSSAYGLRRLSFKICGISEDDPMAVIIQCSTLTSLDLTCGFNFGSSIQDLSFPNIKLSSIRDLRITMLFKHPLGDFVDFLVEAIFRAGSPLEKVELHAEVSGNTLRTLCNRTTLQSLYFTSSDLDEYTVRQLISKNHSLISLHLGAPIAAYKPIVERILSVEGTRQEFDQYIGNVSTVMDFLSKNSAAHFGFVFGLNQRCSKKVQFLKEIKLRATFTAEETSFQGLYELLSVCKLLRKVDVRSFVPFGERKNQNPMLCRALEALIGCPDLEYLCAPVGNKTLRHILSGVKGLRTLEVYQPFEDFTDESLHLLKENSPFLRRLSLTYKWSDEGGITDKGLEYLSFCSQLQSLCVLGSNIGGSGLSHIEKRCLWLNDLHIYSDDNAAEISRIISALGFENKGCNVILR